MKTLLRLACVACAAAISSTAPLFAQGWETVLNFQLVTGPGQGAGGNAIAADAIGNVFAGGGGKDASGVSHGLVLKTDTTQAVWYFSDDTNPSATQYNSYLWNLGYDINGNLYSIGQLEPRSTAIRYWYVRKSADSGLNWSTVDVFQYAAGQSIDATGFAADDAGNIYVAGWSRDAGTKKNPSGNLHWLVKKSADAGQTWALVDDVQGPTANGAGFVPGAGVFAVGGRFTGGTGSWLVRRSFNGAAGSWSTVDGPFASGAARAVCSDSQGNIYVTGTMYIGSGRSGYYAWTTRKSSDGGSHWSTVDTFNYAQSKSSDAYGIGRNAAGNVVVVGRASDAQDNDHWIVRTPGSSATWQTIEDFQLAPGYRVSASAVATDAAGNLLVTGTAQDAMGSHWIVRRLANTTP